MIALGENICSDETVYVGHHYLAGDRGKYDVLVVHDRDNVNRRLDPYKEIPIREAVFLDARGFRRTWKEFANIHAIY